MNDPWVDRLSEYLDGELDENESRELESHLRDCEECAAVLDELGDVVRRARGLTDPHPPEHVWAGIAASISGTEDRGATPLDDNLVKLPQRHPTSRRPEHSPWFTRKAVTIPLPQLIAACLVIMVAAGALGWFARPQGGGGGLELRARVAEVPVAGEVQLARGPGEYDGGSRIATPMWIVQEEPAEEAEARVAAVKWEQAVEDQERIYRSMLADLDTTTVRVLEKNLQILDRSIEEIREAKDKDPSSPLLDNRLTDSIRRKFRLLRWASNISTRET